MLYLLDEINKLSKKDTINTTIDNIYRIKDLTEAKDLIFTEDQIQSIINKLSNIAISAVNLDVQEAALELLVCIFTYNEVNISLNFDLLLNRMYLFDDISLENIIFLLGFSQNSTYLNTLNELVNNDNETLRTAAKEAIADLKIVSQ